MADHTPFTKQVHQSDVTIGWICAILVEFMAARAMLDNEFDLPRQMKGDPNTYVVGQIAGHYVVIACLDNATDPASATSTAAHLLRSFPNVRCGLMVGIAGGVPTWEDHDIRLGDVVVSHPRALSGGVVAFEVGKAIDDRIEYRGHFNSAPEALRNAANALDSQKGMKRYKNRGVEIMQEASNNLSDPAWPPPDECQDVLLCSKGIHESDHDTQDCWLRCDPVTKQAARSARSDRRPRIHRGLLASSHKVIADERQRDRVVNDLYARGYQILAFETEAAALANKFPCLVVRGVSDYADSTKNDTWQRYAALSAAAYAKELLGLLHPEVAEQEPSVIDQSDALSMAGLGDNLHTTVMDRYLNESVASSSEPSFSVGDSGDKSEYSSMPSPVPSLRDRIDVIPPLPETASTDWNPAEFTRNSFVGGRHYTHLIPTFRTVPALSIAHRFDGNSWIRMPTFDESLSPVGRLEAAKRRTKKSTIGRNPAHIAIEQGDLDMLSLLDKEKLESPVLIQADQYIFPVHLAAYKGYVGIIDYLNNAGIDIRAEGRKWREHPIHYAAMEDEVPAIEYLIRHGEAVDVRDKFGQTPLHLAALHGRSDAVHYLICNGHAVAVRDDTWETPLHYAARSNHVEVAQQLVALGHEIEPRTISGSTPMHVAAKWDCPAMINYLHKLGLSVLSTTYGGATPREMTRAFTKSRKRLKALEKLEKEPGRV